MELMVNQYGGQENFLDSPKTGNGQKIVRPPDKSPYLEIVLFSKPEQIFWVIKKISLFSTPKHKFKLMDKKNITFTLKMFAYLQLWVNSTNFVLAFHVCI